MVDPDLRRVPRPLIAVMPKYLTADRLDRSISSCDSLLIADNYLKAIVAAGGVPFVLPVSVGEEALDVIFDMVDGFLFTGGADLDPRLYGGDAGNEKLGVHVAVREGVEYRALDYAFAHDVPILGICRGIQLFNIYKGGTLYEDLGENLPEVDEFGQRVVHWQDIDYSLPSHKVRFVEGSLLSELLDANEATTNSMHHQGVRKLAAGVEAMAYGPGGLVEAVRLPELTFAVGLQWHPEYLGEQEGMNRIFEALIEQAAAYRGRVGA